MFFFGGRNSIPFQDPSAKTQSSNLALDQERRILFIQSLLYLFSF
jgi:hypothetical protein